MSLNSWDYLSVFVPISRSTTYHFKSNLFSIMDYLMFNGVLSLAALNRLCILWDRDSALRRLTLIPQLRLFNL